MEMEEGGGTGACRIGGTRECWTLPVCTPEWRDGKGEAGRKFAERGHCTASQ
jgi:hypothetical protein